MPAPFPVIAAASRVLFAASPLSHALIIYGEDNSGNTSDGGTGNAWDSVVEVPQPTQAHNASAGPVGSLMRGLAVAIARAAREKSRNYPLKNYSLLENTR